jgi:hypothetical protein
MQMFPGVVDIARASRQFLIRAVTLTSAQSVE